MRGAAQSLKVGVRGTLGQAVENLQKLSPAGTRHQ